ncbi:GNAT family N-acetyltransferase [Nocardioides sp. SOB77]|uniref:GNAT family N-acetyltransferase n=1 Tax=Nocardioides oceani TaxID=3058369 RepID=A0ABT8FMV0_9ACTN|nr:GNAT family N-acetyltransferase [Nocardioides oceani]MDN4175855.1 GNAT family N-acetyltransferase [Nocardioides oceani]
MPAPDDRITYRRIQSVDLPFVVEQHQQYFPRGFFARLGGRFLTRYYLTYCTSDDAIAVAATADGVRAGYMVGTISPQDHRQHILRWHRSALAVEGALGLIRHPSLVATFLRTRALLYARKLTSPRTAVLVDADNEKVAVLNHLVVLPQFQGQGIASCLIERLETAAALAGCTSIVLVTETDGQGAAYYHSTGWTVTSARTTRDGQHLTSFSRPILSGTSKASASADRLSPQNLDARREESVS